MPASLGRAARAIARQKQSNKKQREKFVSESAIARDAAIADWYGGGGDVFVRWVKKYHRTSSGEPLSWDEVFLEEIYLAVGCPWLEKAVIKKAAQVGYSEALVATAEFYASYLRSPIGFGFEEQQKLSKMVSTRIQPAFDYCEPIQKLNRDRHQATGREDIDNQGTITIAGTEISFFYACVKSKTLEEQAPATLRSFKACATLADEFSLWPPGVLDIAVNRMAASRMPTKLVRAGSTPSYEGSILDSEIKRAKYSFQWQVKCPHCQTTQFLVPFSTENQSGNFLRPALFKEGDTEELRFFAPTGRPLKWFHRSPNPENVEDWQLKGEDRERAIASAYIGCHFCFEEIPRFAIAAGKFACNRSGITLRDLNDRAVRDREIVRETVAIEFPVLASLLFSAPERLRRLFDTDNPRDEIQQRLGESISLSGGKIDLGRLLSCVGRSHPDFDKPPTLTVMGLDQGRPNFGIIQQWYLSFEGQKTDWWKNARVNTVWFGELGTFEDVDAIALQHSVDLIGIDSEPEIKLATEYALLHLPTGPSVSKKGDRVEKRGQVYLFDQVSMTEQFKRTIRKEKSTAKETAFIIYSIDRTSGLDNVRDRIYRGLFHLPEGLTYDAKDKGNFLYHFITSERYPNRRWIEAPNTPDHYFHAANFAEMCVLVSLFEPGIKKIAFSSINM